MNNVVITGADGFVGSHTTKKFLSEGCKVLALGHKEEPNRLTHHDNLCYKAADFLDLNQLRSTIPDNEYDTMIHFAWSGSAGVSRTDYTLQMQNALATVELMKLAKQKGFKRFVCAGSIMEYEVTAAIQTQGSRPGMGYIYGMGKYIAHCLCKSVAADIGIDLIWPMITNAYGEGEFSPRFINTTIRKIINNEPLQFTSATQNYDFVYISDVADAFYLIAKNGLPFHEYIIGSSNAQPLKQFILELCSSLNSGSEPIFGDVPFTGTDLPLSVYDCSNTEKDTGFRAKINFETGTRMTMEWIKKNM